MAATADISKPGISGQRPRSDIADLAIAVACGLALLVTALLLAMLPAAGHLTSSCDFISYWATGQQLVHHANPYDPIAMERIEHAAGWAGTGAYYMRNPPWALPLAWPLGLVSIRVAVLPWSLLMFAVLAVSVRMLRTMFGARARRIDLLGYAFPPALLCVVMGQTSLLALLGLVLFLRLHRTQPVWAGAALWLCTLKPHLFVPFAVVLLAWIVVSRSYRILLGAGIAGAVSCLLTVWIYPGAFAQYLAWARTSGITQQPVPCLAVLLRKMIDPSATWLVLVPCVLGCVWALKYFFDRRERWDWLEHGSLLVLVSLVVAPYCFLFDQSLAIPALLYAAGRFAPRGMLIALAALYLAVELQPLLFQAPSVAYWTWLLAAPAWLAWYWFAGRSQAAPQIAHAAAPVLG
jgi:hypothetical protein